MVSVVIPLYNKVRHIKRALDSVLAQTYPDFEVIVVNDGSTDGSDKVVEQFTDPRVRLVNQENAGVSAARNRGITEAKGELIAFLDADDEWLPEHLATACRLAAKHPECGAFASSYRVVSSRGGERTPAFDGIPGHPWEGALKNYFRTALTSDPLWTSAVVVRKNAFGVCGCFPAGVRTGEDVDMWCRIALHFPVAFSTTPGAIYHQEAGNRSVLDVDEAICPVVVGTLDAALTAGRLPNGVNAEDLIEYRNKWLIGFATHCLIAGERKLAREFCSRAVSTRKFRSWRWRNLAASCLPSAVLKRLR